VTSAVQVNEPKLVTCCILRIQHCAYFLKFHSLQIPLASTQKQLKNQLERDKIKQNQHQKDKRDKFSTITAHVTGAALAPAAFAGGSNNAVSWIRPKSNLEVKTSLASTPTTSFAVIRLAQSVADFEGARAVTQINAYATSSSCFRKDKSRSCFFWAVHCRFFIPESLAPFEAAFLSPVRRPAFNFQSPTGAFQGNCFVSVTF
jgi:hypothetical protein